MNELSICEREALVGYLGSDLGKGDPTSALFGPDDVKSASIVCNEDCVLSGIEAASYIFSYLGAKCSARTGLLAGSVVRKGTKVSSVRGPVNAILSGERTALNVLSRMSGIATYARKASDLAGSTSAGTRVAGTRKTTPGFNLFEKRALMDGGALPHRMDLSTLAMVKDNHIRALGSGPEAIEKAVSRIRRLHGPYLSIEVECEDLDEAIAALRSGADIIMLDNMGAGRTAKVSSTLREAMTSSGKRAVIEASGGFMLEDIPKIAPHVDVISMGSLTYGAPCIDFTMELS